MLQAPPRPKEHEDGMDYEAVRRAARSLVFVFGIENQI